MCCPTSRKQGHITENISVLLQAGRAHLFCSDVISKKNSDYLENGEIKKDNLIKIYMRSEKTLYGTIHFNYMIPVPAAELTEFTMNDEGDFKYKVLMQSEYFFYQGKQKQNRKDRCTTLQNADNI